MAGPTRPFDWSSRGFPRRLRVMHSVFRKEIYWQKGTNPMTEHHRDTEVLLEGGPDDIPRRLFVTREQIADGKVKVPYLSGYEHFVRKITDDAANLFAWTTSTKIAE